MRYLIIVKASPESETGCMPGAELLAEMAAYHEVLARAGALLDGAGLRPSAEGWRIRHEGGTRRVIDGPFARGQALIAGYTLIQVRGREEALEWTWRFPNPRGGGQPAEIEVRPLFSLEDLPHPAEVSRFRALGVGGG